MSLTVAWTLEILLNRQKIISIKIEKNLIIS